MVDARFIAGDWGTSHLRLMLCDAQGRILDLIDGPGAAAARGAFADIFDALVAGWLRRDRELPTILCGMVGASFGWTPVPYRSCPASPEQIASSCAELRDGRIRLVPGLSCRNRLEAPDFLRGEETQILGALRLQPELLRGRHLLCLPGTHTKWVVLEDGSVSEFLTAPAGELYELLCRHSVLVRDQAGGTPAHDAAAFAQGLQRYRPTAAAGLLQQLFECRSRRLSGELAGASAASFLSGLLIANDVGGALQLFAGAISAGTVHLIGSPELMWLYSMALASHGCTPQSIDGSAASLAGLLQLSQLILPGALTP